MSSETSSPTPKRLYGGQAVIEGVMMRGPRFFAVACRRANGQVAVTCEEVPKSLRPDWQKLPFLRGAFSIVDAMALGTRALFWAAKVAEADIPKPSSSMEDAIARAEIAPVGVAPVAGIVIPGVASPNTSRVTDVAIGSAMILGLAIGIGLIVGIPYFITEVIGPRLGITGWWQTALLDGIVRLAIFFGYISLVGRYKHVRRTFEYHGAEHKVINALESGAPLTVETALAQTRLHPRCGTSFVVIVMVVATLVFAVFRESPLYALLLPKLPENLATLERILTGIIRLVVMVGLMMPIAGISFELLRLAGKYRGNPIADALSRPGMWTQLLTTREPDAKQIEVAIASLKEAMKGEGDLPDESHPDRAPMRESQTPNTGTVVA
ncbi:MAG: DUF1385 domain-containing protein [Fibrella sp.]|nr:DUF1385 domain-containing protein [Armatimonadota bacterium]